jgi:hypothetical protein
LEVVIMNKQYVREPVNSTMSAALAAAEERILAKFSELIDVKLEFHALCGDEPKKMADFTKLVYETVSPDRVPDILDHNDLWTPMGIARKLKADGVPEGQELIYSRVADALRALCKNGYLEAKPVFLPRDYKNGTRRRNTGIAHRRI